MKTELVSVLVLSFYSFWLVRKLLVAKSLPQNPLHL